MTAPRVLIRADSGGRLGAGHVTRCLALADELSQRGADVEFATRSPLPMRRLIAGHGHRLVELPPPLDDSGTVGAPWAEQTQLDDARTTLAATSGDFDVVVVDHYGLGAAWERAVGDGRTVLVLDDLASRPHQCALLCDQNWYGPQTRHRYDGLVDADCSLLLGPRYAVLQPQYRRERLQRAHRTWPPKHALVSFGGTDPAHETEKAVRAFSIPEFEDLGLTVVVGTVERADEQLRTLVAARPNSDLVVSAPSLAPYLARADLAIGASGAGTWERLCLGVPAVVATTAPHQSGVTAALARTDITAWVGLMSETDNASYQDAVRRLCADEEPFIPPVVDGFGAARLAEAVMPSSDDDLRVRRAVGLDAPSQVGLEGESTGSGPDLLDGPAVWVAEAMRFETALADTTRVSFVVEMAGVPLGGGTVEADASVRVGLHHPISGRGIESKVIDLVLRLVGNGKL